jgi:Amt family ammonium transporter
MMAPAATLVVWTIIDAIRSGKPTTVGCATAIVVGLVAVTPAAGHISPMSALALGAIAAVPSYLGLMIRPKTGLDDSLDVVAAHGVGGTVGALLTGVFAQKALNGTTDGALFGKAIALFMPLRATKSEEAEGLDITAHGEEAYIHMGGSMSPAPSKAKSSAGPVFGTAPVDA